MKENQSYSLSTARRAIILLFYYFINTLFSKYCHDGEVKREMTRVLAKLIHENIQYDQVKHYQVLEKKQGRCKVCKNTLK